MAGTSLMLSEHLTYQDPILQLRRKFLLADLGEVLSTLTSREAEVIDLYFGLSSGHPSSLREISALFSLSRERVRCIKEKAIRRLRFPSRSARLYHYWRPPIEVCW